MLSGAIGALAAYTADRGLGGDPDALGPLAPPNGIAGLRLWLMLLVLPLESGIVAIVTALIAVLRQLWRMP